ncbi:MAG: hypothetical protein IKE69_05255, partial [Thermoguttaceae bacterium]|nr:hypothetical protein [Thermoguttaceae bacterium]
MSIFNFFRKSQSGLGSASKKNLEHRRFRLENLEERTLLTAAPWSTGDEAVAPFVQTADDPVETLIVVTDAVPTVSEVDDPTVSVGGSANVITEAAPGDTVYVSVYVKSTDPNYGITVGYCSLYYDVDGFTPTGYYDSPNFSEQTINSGYDYSASNYISAFGGVPSNMTVSYGKTQWALAGTESFTVSDTADGEYTFSNGMARNAKGNEKKSWNFLREDSPVTYSEEVTFTSTTFTVKGETPVDPVETLIVVTDAVPTVPEVDDPTVSVGGSANVITEAA